ncbi:LysR substrate-binding domain-containing protein [Variovorax saccharolyticus]|uniref:LysR substrate-binding domain-containing protein n=1 Tax=Variovorax saccharolyticus TaxID=3053516 RepID=UPI00336A76CE
MIGLRKGCAYRRVLEQWLGGERLATMRVVEPGSYHAILACVAAGSSFAVIPELLPVPLPEHFAAHDLPAIIGLRNLLASGAG